MFIIDSSIDLEKQLVSLIGDERDAVANMSNFSAFVFHSFPALNWAGFYLTDRNKKDELVLGPFQGGVACIRIPYGKGVCGTAATTLQIQNVPDVEQFPGHIACDSATQSELVLPIVYQEKTIGVFDIDSPDKDRFDKETENKIRKLLSVLIQRTDWNMLHK